MAAVFGRPGLDWTVVLRRQPVRIVAGQPEGGYTSMFEIICCDCGDDPSLDYREVSPELQRVRGPYPIAAGIAAYEEHLTQHENRGPAHLSGARSAMPARTGRPGSLGNGPAPVTRAGRRGP